MLAEYHILSNRDASHDPPKDTQISLRVPLKGLLNPKPQTPNPTPCFRSQVLSQEDPQLLQQYLQQRSPFSLDGLLVMAEHHWRQGSHEQARELVRRAVYTLECSLSPDFSPFQARTETFNESGYGHR